MALSDLYNTQPSEQYGVTTTTNNYFEDGAFGLKEKAREAFKEQTGVSYEDASQETINDLRDSQFNPILDETGAVNDDGSYNDDVMDDITEDPSDIHDPGSDSGGGIPLIGGTNTGGLPSYVPSLGGSSGDSDPSDGSDFMPFKGLIDGTQDVGQRLVDLGTWEGPGELLGDVGQLFTPGGSSDDSGFSLGFLEKIMVLAAILILGPSIIKALSGDN